MVTMGILPYQEKIPMVEPGIMISSQKRWPLDHEAVSLTIVYST
jgi:hypothetical protein